MQRILTSVFILSVGLFILPLVSPINAGDEVPDCGGQKAVVDNACQREKILRPSSDCQLFICPGDSTTADPETQEILNVNFFGVAIRANSSLFLQTLLYVAFNLFLAVAAIAVTGLGVYGSFLRARAESDDDVIKSAKILRNALVGLGIIALSFLIAQLTANFLGLGSINEIVDFSNLGLDTVES